MPFIINENTEIIKMNTLGEIEISTDNINLVGLYDLYITAKLTEFPDIKTPNQAISVQFRFKMCDVIIKPWDLQDKIIPASESASYTIDAPGFIYQSPLVSCNYFWESFEVAFSLQQTEEEAEDIEKSGREL